MGEVACAEANARATTSPSLPRSTPRPWPGSTTPWRPSRRARPNSTAGHARPNLHAAALDLARTRPAAPSGSSSVCPAGAQRAPVLLQYLNRLSDLLWLMGREAENT